MLDSRKSADGKDVLATCTADPHASDDSFNVIRVPSGNGRFRSLGVHSGDILKYYVKEDKTVDADSRNAGYSRQLAMDLNVAQVIDDNTLFIENGLNQEVPNPGRKIEIWRYVDDRLEEIHEKLSLYEVYRRPPLAWEPAPDEPVLTQVMAWLNQWIRQSDPKTDWQRDTLIDTLDANLRGDTQLANLISPDALAAPAFQPYDARFLQEAIWLRDISRWAHGNRFDDLSRASALFDWTVRNIQLEAGENAPPHRPWQTLLFGRGTAEQRAWVFALLGRQQGLDVVMLAVRRRRKPIKNPPPHPLLPLIGCRRWLPKGNSTCSIPASVFRCPDQAAKASPRWSKCGRTTLCCGSSTSTGRVSCHGRVAQKSRHRSCRRSFLPRALRQPDGSESFRRRSASTLGQAE